MRRVERVAGALLDRLRMGRPPVDVQAVAKVLGIRVVYEPLEGLAGTLLRYKGREVAVINSDQPEHRQRFSLAHEIGHSQLHPIGATFACVLDEAPSTRIEREASWFAAELLMPEWAIRQHFFMHYTEEQIAEAFNVSQESVHYRIKDLDLRRAQ